MFPLQFDIVYFCKFFAFYTFWFIIHQILAKIKILNKSNALKILIFSVLQKYIWTRNICTAISALIPFLFGTAANITTPKPSESEWWKSPTGCAGSMDCLSLRSPAKPPQKRGCIKLREWTQALVNAALRELWGANTKGTTESRALIVCFDEWSDWRGSDPRPQH